MPRNFAGGIKGRQHIDEPEELHLEALLLHRPIHERAIKPSGAEQRGRLGGVNQAKYFRAPEANRVLQWRQRRGFSTSSRLRVDRLSSGGFHALIRWPYLRHRASRHKVHVPCWPNFQLLIWKARSFELNSPTWRVD